MDRGFLFGDGIYEVFPAYDRMIIGLDSHLNRLQDGLDAINIKNPHSKDEWKNLIDKIISFDSINKNQAVYLQISRGSDENRKHTYEELKPTVYIQSSAIKQRDKSSLLNGMSAITREDIRWLKSDTKATSLLANTLYAQEAKNNDAEETILYRNGIITEASTSNVFIAKNNCIYTHPKGPIILPGITREKTILCAKANHMSVEETPFTTRQLMEADEVWITSSTREIIPITTIDGIQISNGCAGPIWSTLYDEYQSLKS
ncbi:aminotransferase class IV [Pseudothioglobus sp. nBUS_23]|uniref:aminotransferase class IV n=1 Tax=Pseudothioglobus sp. nBUS_23 TaxID=3395318 RepID=UPI003EBF6193